VIWLRRIFWNALAPPAEGLVMPQKRRKELPEENQTLSRPPRRLFDARRAAGEEVTPIDRGNIYTIGLRSFQRNGL
jgi:hypothetical protein